MARAVAVPLMGALATLVFLLVGWWVLFEARIGPVVATLSEGHGIHSGDALGVGSLALGLACAACTHISARQRSRVLALVSTR